MVKYGMVIDLRKCVGCHSCTVSCKFENNVPKDRFRTWVRVWEKGVFPDVQLSFLPRLCNHCENPPCTEICPVGATFKISNGIVVIDKDECIGCGYCIQACPYDARYKDPKTGTADKCDFCLHRLNDGLLPACVTTCIGGARIFGDLDDPTSEVSKLVNTEAVNVLFESYGTEPNIYYINLEAEPLKPINLEVLN